MKECQQYLKQAPWIREGDESRGRKVRKSKQSSEEYRRKMVKSEKTQKQEDSLKKAVEEVIQKRQFR